MLSLPLVALTSNCLKASRLKGKFCSAEAGKCQMLAPTATATDFLAAKAAWPLLWQGLFVASSIAMVAMITLLLWCSSVRASW